MGKIVVVMGSKKDIDHAKIVEKIAKKFRVPCELRIASAHKTPNKVLKIIEEYQDEEVVYITIAGKSNALSGLVDANTTKPVIASPPYSSKFGLGDIFSSLRMPRGVSPMVILDPEQSALAAIKILGLYDKELQVKISNYQNEFKKKIEQDDQDLNG
ncbi:MAG: AIR carboxylase family protein [candidate division WOR-3 bacterium]|nr:AIR carboxylase family protein [candidate division WOR-3 bacterium]